MKKIMIDPTIRKEQVDAIQMQLPKDWEIIDQIEKADFIVTGNMDISEDNLRSCEGSLKGIIQILPGSAKIAQVGIPVYSVYDTGLTGVAEHAIMLMLVLSRRLLWLIEKVKNQEWVEGKSTPVLTDQKNYTYNWVGLPESGQLHGKTVGIVGFGFIGQDLARRLKAFHAKIIYYDIVRASSDIETLYEAKYAPLDELLQCSDFVTLHLRYIEGEGGNKKMFRKQLFEKMKPTAYFINTSRGQLVDEAALAEAIQNHRIAGAGLDVFEYEPFKPDCPLFPLISDHVILTPHVAGTYVEEARKTIAMEIVEIIREKSDQ